MECRPCEAVEALDIGQNRSVELTNRCNHEIGRQRLATALIAFAGDCPLVGRFIEFESSHLNSKAGVVLEGKLPGRGFDVIEDLIPAGKLACPGRIGFRVEGVTVEVVGRIDTTAGIGVLQPRPAESRVFLQDRERYAHLLQANCSADAAKTPADDDGISVVQVEF